ncbi:MAG: CehA/McbA family metallohydrolase [Planctomycetota bacterium]
MLLEHKAVSVKLPPVRAPWLVFMHVTDLEPIEWNEDGFISPTRGEGRLGEHVADYVLIYGEGAEERVHIRRRHHIGMFSRRWGENCFEAVTHHKPHPAKSGSAEVNRNDAWGRLQTRVFQHWPALTNWLWAWENPRPRRSIVSVRFEPVSGRTIVWAISAGRASSMPLRWERRRKAVLVLPRGESFVPNVDDHGLLSQIRLDLGQVISAAARPLYPNDQWRRSYNNSLPELSAREVLVEYAAHLEAHFHLTGGSVVPVSRLESKGRTRSLRLVSPAGQRVTLRAVEKGTRKAVPVKLHVHGEAGEYLAPVDRHRIINADWFQDYSVDFSHQGIHHCAYIPGECRMDLPVGQVFIEVSKGFEIKPVRKAVRVSRRTREINVEIEKVLPWREKGWVSADTHVHFLSPESALLEGSGEGVNVVNLLASQWGELVTNVGDFDGKTTIGSREAGGDGEYLVRVGTENRQHILGHISLLGYNGHIIAPMTTGGPGESALGDPVGALLTEWAQQCKRQAGVVVIPHFPNPRAEHAATIVTGNADAVEMTSWGNLYDGIDPYSLSDWYRYLNCGYMTAAVGGTDKMSASTAVGTVRTYARVDTDEEFTYKAWKEAVRRAHTFVTYGPLLEFAVEGRPPGSRIKMSRSGGTLDVTWQVASVTVPMSRVDLVVNGEIRESKAVRQHADEGHWSVPVAESSWLALLVRGHYADKPEIIAAHSTPVMVDVARSPFLAAADAVTILEQIEGAIAFLDSVGTRAEARAYRRMRLVLTAAHRELHNRMHRQGRYHEHTPADDHPGHC